MNGADGITFSAVEGNNDNTAHKTDLTIFGSVRIHTRSGIKNAAVFPLPVSATPMTSRFSRPIGIACRWIGDGSFTDKTRQRTAISFFQITQNLNQNQSLSVSGVGTGGSGGSMNRGPRAPGAPSSGATEIFLGKTLRKIIKIVATRWRILRLKCTKFDFGWGSAPDTAGGGYSAPPDPLAGFGRPLRGRGRGWAGEGGGGEVEGREREGPQVTVEPEPLRALLRHWEGRPACKKIGCWFIDNDMAGLAARIIAPVVTTTSIILSFNEIQNWDILVPANPSNPPGKCSAKVWLWL